VHALPHVNDAEDLRAIANGTREQHIDLAQCAGFKASVLAAGANVTETDRSTKSILAAAARKFPFRAVKLADAVGAPPPAIRQFATLKDGNSTSTVLVEWKSYVQHASDLDAIQKLEGGVSQLAALLSQPEQPEGFNVLRCAGYYNHLSSNKFGLLFSPPPWAAAPSKEPRTLRDLLGGPVPSLGTRFSLDNFLLHNFEFSLGVLVLGFGFSIVDSGLENLFTSYVGLPPYSSFICP
jgi:hypothetical protein